MPEPAAKQGPDRRQALFWLRFVSGAALAGILVSQSSLVEIAHSFQGLVFLVYLVWLFAGFAFPKTYYHHQGILTAFFLVDTLLVLLLLKDVASLYGELYLIYFMAIFFGVLSRTVVGSAGAALLAVLLYSFLQYLKTGTYFSMEPGQLIRYPFIFVTGILSGFLAEETGKEDEEKRRLKNVSSMLADKMDLATHKLVESNRKLKAMLEYHSMILSCIHTGIIVVHPDGQIRTFNEGATKITGFHRESMEGKKLVELPERIRPVTGLIEKSLAEGKSYNVEDLVMTSNRGETLPLSLQTSIMRVGEGPILGVIGTIRDMSLIRQMEIQLTRAERMSALGEMASGVAHEIKNPLNAIQGFSQRLVAKLEDPTFKKYAETIVREVERLDTIVNDVLEYGRTMRPVKAPVAIRELMEEIVLYLSDKLQKANVKVEQHFDPALKTVELDRNKMKQVILNLVLNALAAMPQGGTLTLRTAIQEGLSLSSGAASDPGQWVSQVFLSQKVALLTVQDTGCGIPKENIPKLFHPFFTTKTTGTGLGLSICHKIVEGHGGTILVNSVEGVGTTFTLQFPIEGD